MFSKSPAFLYETLAHPGGICKYLSALMSQFLYIGWAGTLVVTLQAWFLCIAVGYIFRTVRLPGWRFLSVVPAIILLTLYTNYIYYFETTTACLMALLLACLYLKVQLSLKLNSFGQLTVLLVLSFCAYVITGGAYLLFILVCVLYESLFRRRVLLSLGGLILAVGIPYVVGLLIFRESIVNAFSALLPWSWKTLSYRGRRPWIAGISGLYAFVPMVLLLWPAYRKILLGPLSTAFASRAKRFKVTGNRPMLRSILHLSLLLVVAGTGVFFAKDRERKALFAVQYYASHRMWPQVLQAAQSYPDNPLIVNAVNRALYHTGRLGYDMFCWPQHPETLLPTGDDHNLTCWQKFDALIDLGLMNIAERNLVECTQVYGNLPMILQRLALINLVKANYGSARIYLGALSQTLFHSDWAHHYLTLLQSDHDLSTDSRIQELRSLCPERDYATIGYAKERLLRDQLQEKGQNRMAFEYLCAWYMLNKQLEKCVRTIGQSQAFNYPKLPRLYEEVALIYVYGTRKPIQLPGYQPSPKARQRIEEFSRVFNRHGRNKRDALAELAQGYGDSYFFYHIYGMPGG